MTKEERTEAIFGAYDGVVSVVGFVFALLVINASAHTIAVGGLGGAIAAAISMGSGEVEKGDEPWFRRLPIGATMFCASLIGSLVPVVAFFFLDKPQALGVAAIGCVGVATWIGWMKRKGAGGYVSAYVSLLLASGLTLGVVSLLGGA